MGELIEHLTDFSTALNNVRAWLKPDGKLVLTTPNALSAYWLLFRSLNREFVNPEHTCWFDETTLTQLLSRCNFDVERIDYVRMSRLQSFARPTTAAGYLIERLLPERIAHRNLVAVAKPV
jgi:2-polyprenyl-3-methyl-5-hydroxy-6-metoxy-1,4-benzoquinol methylase